MHRKILIGYDGTPEGKDALGLGHLLGTVLEATPIVTTVIRHERNGSEDREFEAAVAEFCRPLFATARECLQGLKVVERPVVNDSRPAALYELADWEKPELIVIGSTRQGPTGRVVVGTLGQSLLSGVHSGVAVAPRGYAGLERRLERVGVAVDGSSESWRALNAAGVIAARADVPLRVLSAMGPPHYVLGGLLSPLRPEEYREFKEKEWGAVYEEAERRAPYGIRTEFELLHGDPAEELAKAAEHIDLLLVGSRGYGPVKGALLGSVSAKLMSSAGCPMIVVARGAGSHPLED